PSTFCGSHENARAADPQMREGELDHARARVERKNCHEQLGGWGQGRDATRHREG
ncbi:hypothetical protein CEXT_347551, partial [Caerostris extrusa]